MNDLFLKYAYFLDNLREDYGIKTKDFCEDVCEPRTYRMYISGKRVMSQKMINGFCKKLKLTPNDFYSSFNRNDYEEYIQISKIYNHLTNNQYENARKLLIIFDKKNFINYNAQLLYDYCIIRYNYKTNQIVKAEALNRYSNLINYPKCLDKMTFTIQETLSIAAIAELENEIKEVTALNFLTKFLSSPNLNLSSSNHKNVLPSMFSHVAYLNGLNDNFEYSLGVSKRGIRFCIANDSLRELDRLFYYSFLSCLRLNLPEKDYYCRKYINTVLTKYSDEEYHKKIISMLIRDTDEYYIQNILNTQYDFLN
ncbi:hypothetical protein KQ51_00088 [Candidatus Izimaplasma bacterium HR1]|jgi:hypothetical protein|uniref:hypothetical protein n=1 Tax=Candidatus Izimoplasma sp. HR1 TaxID=1541959 RepID=UPI0004F5E983|nr:hypothetical protein KQ51_00088 [Candidatus Izimaplasma bacterium HR1]